MTVPIFWILFQWVDNYIETTPTIYHNLSNKDVLSQLIVNQNYLNKFKNLLRKILISDHCNWDILTWH